MKDFGSGEEWVAQAGEGATVNGRTLGGVRPKPRLGIVDLEATNGRVWSPRPATRLDGHVGRIRLLGALALALCQLADGEARRCRHAQAVAVGRSRGGGADRPRGRGELSLTVETDALPLDLESRSRVVAARDREWAQTLAGSWSRRRRDLYTSSHDSQDAIREALVGVIDPEIRRSVVELDMVRGVDVAGEPRRRDASR